MSQVEILFGSKNDLTHLKQSNLLEQLEEAGISYTVSVCSAHRNARDLTDYMTVAMHNNTAVYICAAGMAAALPGAVAAELLGRSLATVIGVALPSTEYPDGKDAEISITRLPPGITVTYGGFSTEAFNDIGDDVITLATQYNPNPDPAELEAIRVKIKPPQFNIDMEEIDA